MTHDIASYNILLKSCCLAANVDLAQDIYREVQCLESKGTLKLDVFTYSTMIKVYHLFHMYFSKCINCLLELNCLTVYLIAHKFNILVQQIYFIVV